MLNRCIDIRETTEEDLNHIVELWNSGDVMFYVGFPNGLGVSKDALRENWLPKVNQNDKKRHYSIYEETLGYCGECYYSVEEDGTGILDIKLLPKARGKGIGYQGLKFAIDHAFNNGKAKKVVVDPHKKNLKAISLYEKLGFICYDHPQPKYKDTHYYMELNKDDDISQSLD
jgi:RimJ/RimL family protein N-acetyltransferase